MFGRDSSDGTEATQQEVSLQTGTEVLNRLFSRQSLMAAAALTAGVWAARRWYRRISFEGKSVVITGGSRGLGLELARLFADEGARVTLLARDEEELDRAVRTLTSELTDPEVQGLVCDVSQKEEVDQVIDEVLEKWGTVDVLLNNAGIIVGGPVESITRKDVEDAMDVHLWGAYNLTEAVVPVMKGQGGRIVNISSIGGQVAVPHLLAYTVSKFALKGFSDGMRAELAQDGIYVTTVCPGLMRTGSHVNAWFRGQHRKEFGWFALSAASPFLSMNPQRAARAILRACRYGKGHLTLTLPARVLEIADTVFPNLVASVMKQASRLLPSPRPEGGSERRRGAESTSSVAPSLLTRLADWQIFRNNELVGSRERKET